MGPAHRHGSPESARDADANPGNRVADRRSDAPAYRDGSPSGMGAGHRRPRPCQPLERCEHRPPLSPHELSGGERQRVSIAIALSLEPDLIVLDEPTTNLDATTEAAILDLLEDIRARVDSAMIYISHNFGVIARIATQIAVMYAGEIVETGPTAAIFRPDSARTYYPHGHCWPAFRGPALTKEEWPLGIDPGRLAHRSSRRVPAAYSASAVGRAARLAIPRRVGVRSTPATRCAAGIRRVRQHSAAIYRRRRKHSGDAAASLLLGVTAIDEEPIA